MLTEISVYFSAEKQESLLFIVVGIFATAIAVWLWTQGHRLKTMAFPLVGVAAIQFVVGSSVYVRTDRQVSDLVQLAELSPSSFKRDETNRMAIVMKNFRIYKAIEILLLVIGITLIVFFQRYDFAAGIGAGLVLQSAFMLCLDIFAESRGQDYLTSISAFGG